MGVPKFFRYISERYPCLSEVVKEYQIPEFDNLYLDMNGIIHMCSHPDDYDPHFRISEEKMFCDIFHYIEVLFRMIKPQKLFFMAVDGVAPRAKMNQQRGRRFRSAKEAETLEAKARERGEELPKEARFDSNCITPGTVFMARLHEQLKYFVSHKISTDKIWQKCKIILSGHETPGEGEHKIMDYIRYMKAQPGYDPNTRHCLYGLDADLIMLGLCTHEPHFSLLREEVRFGKKAKRKNIPEQITFYLLHLSLMREYLELEFLPLKETLPFEYDMEKIIDDWVLMGFLVGNDFIPHLPNLHIANGALPVLYNAYMKVLSTLDGYINEGGTLNLDRFEKFMAALASVEREHFSEQYADLKYFQSKTGRKLNEKERTSYKPKDSDVWLPDDCDDAIFNDVTNIKTTNKELEALIKCTDDLLLEDPFLKNDTTDNSATTEIKLLSNPDLLVTAKVEDLLTGPHTETTSETGTKISSNSSPISNHVVDDKSSDKLVEPLCGDQKEKAENVVLLEPSESNLADLALDDIEIHDDDDDALSPCISESDTEDEELMNAEFIQHKNDYYMNKLDYSKVTPEVMRDQAEGYVRAIQWNLHYYYNGVCSWSWYYPHHYAPYISDIKEFSDLKLEYDLGRPFQPFEQLLAVLPAASKTLLPEIYQELMTSEDSLIIDYYPQEFRTDLNGKKQEWEAVVLIPFIAEDLLLKAMGPCNQKLTEDEKKRNTHGPMLISEFTAEDLGLYKAPDYFPDIEQNHAKVTPVTIEEIRVPVDKLVKGPCAGSIHDVYYPGFPTFKHLKYKGHLEKAKVRVFDTPSQNDNMIIKIETMEKDVDIEEVARKLLGGTVYVSWPHLIEAHVITVSDSNCRYHKTSEFGKFNLEVNKGNLQALWYSQRNGRIVHYKEKFGVDVGESPILIHVKTLVGTKNCYTQAGRITFEKIWADVELCFPLQAVVQDLVVHESLREKYENIQDLFPLGSKCFMIGHPHYGSMGEVIDNTSLKGGRIKVSMCVQAEPYLAPVHQFSEEVRYMPGSVAAQRLTITPHLLSRITGSVFAIPGVKGNSIPKNSSKMNIGLNLKLNKKNEEIPGYTKKVDGQWLYSQKSVNLANDYMDFCPELFAYIASHLGNDVFYESELFPDEIGEGKIQRLVDWIKKQPFSSIDRQKVGSKTAVAEVVQKIESIVDEFYSSEVPSKQYIMQIKPHLLYKPEVQTGHLAPDPAAIYQVYDRVVNVRDSYTVPFGCKGTVIGIQSCSSSSSGTENDMEVMYDVVFDRPFPGGLKLNCLGNRGYRLPKTALINISYGERFIQQKSINPVANNSWFPGSNQQQQHSIPPVQSQNSAFATWNPNQNNSYHHHHPHAHQQFQQQYHQQQPHHVLQKQQQQQRMFLPPQIHQPPVRPQFNYPMNHHRMAAPAASSSPLQRPVNNQQLQQTGTTAEFRAFLQDLQKNHIKEKNQPAPHFSQASSSAANSTKSPAHHDQKPAEEASSDETEALKKLLNIHMSPSKKQQSVSADKNVTQQISVHDFFAHARSKEQKLTQSATQSANTPFYSVQLLNYCQAQRIGIPRYSYLPSGDNKIRAHITLPDGRMVVGEESATKEEATENAAKIIMTDMSKIKHEPVLKHDLQGQNLYAVGPKGFPAPPKQWCQNQGQQKMPPRSFNKPNTNPSYSKQQPQTSSNRNAGPHGTPHRSNRSEESKSAPGATPFVPLQAVKQHRNKSSSTNVGDGTTMAKRREMCTPGGAQNSPNRAKTNTRSPEKHPHPQSQPSNGQPKQRMRKSRIAANFSGLQPKE